jgi:transcriptional regulator
MAKSSKPDLLQGTLDLLILKTLSLEPMHGWAISQRIKQVSEGEFAVNQGSLYPALHRLQRAGLIAADTGLAENNREVKTYKLTRLGRSRLQEEKENWSRVSAAMSRILEAN